MVVKPNFTGHRKDVATLDSYWTLWKNMGQFPRRILELGIAAGGSLLLWNDMFAPISIVGLDINIEHADLARLRQFPNIHLYAFDQYKPDGLIRIMNRLNTSFDLIIDDCRHGIEAFACMDILWPRLNVGGAYVIEDWNDEWLAEIKVRESLGRLNKPRLNMSCVVITPGFIGLVKNE
jgi:cephalosporin hydroxylase